MNFPLLSDQRIKSVPVLENGDPWIDLKDQTELLLDHTREQIQKISANPFLIRESVYLKLIHAQKFPQYPTSTIWKEAYQLPKDKEAFTDFMLNLLTPGVFTSPNLKQSS